MTPEKIAEILGYSIDKIKEYIRQNNGIYEGLSINVSDFLNDK